jgi:subfamily B ATP-binding cassette protein MsbA
MLKKLKKKIRQNKKKIINLLFKVKWIKNFVLKMGLNPLFIVIPFLLSFAIAFFEGLSTALLIPLLKGIIELDFGFAKEFPFINYITPFLSNFLSESMAIFMVLVGVVFISAVMKNIMGYVSSLSLGYQIIKLNNNFKKFIFNRYLKFGKLFFDRTNQGYLRTILGFTNVIGDLLTKFQGSLNKILMLSVYIVMMIIISWKLTLFILVIFPILHYSLTWFTSAIKKISRRQVFLKKKRSARIFNTLTCIPLIKAYTREKQEKKHFADETDKLGKLSFKMKKTKGLIGPIRQIMSLTAVLLIVSAIAFIFSRERNIEISNYLVKWNQIWFSCSSCKYKRISKDYG